MERSENITTLMQALLAARMEMDHPKKNARNPHFGNTYADLGTTVDAYLLPLSKHGLMLTQWPAGSGLTTMLVHAKSGEYLMETMDLHLDREGPQAVGSALTYARRQSAQAVLMLVGEDDDDAEGAHKPPPKAKKSPPATRQSPPPKDTGGEKKRWDCPECGAQQTVIEGKPEYGGGYLCYGKLGGCGAKWSSLDAMNGPEPEDDDVPF